MKINLKIILVAVVAVTLAISGCYKDNEQDLYLKSNTNDTVTGTFGKTILPIFTANCTAGCHSGGSPSANISLDSYIGIKATPILRIRGSIRHEPGYSAMPKGGSQLSAGDLAKIDDWINQGMPNN
jgi:hypothetical protein